MDNKIKLHNHLGMARYKMSLSEQKVFIYAVSQIDQNKEDFNEVEFTIKELAEATKLNKKQLEKEFDEITTNIMRTVIKTAHPSGNKGFVKYNLTQRCEHLFGTGVVKFRFNDDMKPLLLELKEHYFIQHPHVIEFKSWHSIRLYDYLESIAYNTNEVDVEIETLKELLELTDKYSKWYEFHRRILEPSKDEINDKSDLEINYELIRRGRKAHAIRFFIKKHKSSKETTELIEIHKKMGHEVPKEIVDLLSDEHWSDSTITELYAISLNRINPENTTVLKYMAHYYYYMKNKEPKNRYSYYKDCLTKDYDTLTTQISFV